MSDHKTQPVRGSKDLFGEEILHFNQIIDVAKIRAQNFAFSELQTPIFEFSEIFERNLGESSDIISKEVYKFKDRGDNFLTLRPEFTASVVRALLSNGVLQQSMPQKFFSYGPVFRYDRPQKGRQRQFNQINFEVFGEDSFLMDVEIITLATLTLQDLNIFDKTELHINSLGSEETKAKYEVALKDYFLEFQNDLSEDSKKRFEKNPLRIIDSKDLSDIEICKNAPTIKEFYSKEEAQRIENILQNLKDLQIPYKFNEKLVRGLDYYSSTVFEFVMTDKEGAQNTVLAGGRYDGLVEKMGGKSLPAIGFAAGVERLMLLSELENDESQKIMAVYVDKAQEKSAFQVACSLRSLGFDVDFIFDASFKKQMKKSGQNGVKFALILGEEELENDEINVKNFSDSSEEKVKLDELSEFLASKLIGFEEV